MGRDYSKSEPDGKAALFCSKKRYLQAKSIKAGKILRLTTYLACAPLFACRHQWQNYRLRFYKVCCSKPGNFCQKNGSGDISPT